MLRRQLTAADFAGFRTPQQHSAVATSWSLSNGIQPSLRSVQRLQRGTSLVFKLTPFLESDPRFQKGILIVCTIVFDLESQARSNDFGTPSTYSKNILKI